jgi:hypothetical protein
MNQQVDEISLATHGAEMMNVYVDQLGNVNRFAGFEEFADTGTAAGVDALHWWVAQSRVVAISNGEVHQITDSTGTIAQISGDAFEVGTRAKLDEHGTSLYGANGAGGLKITTSAVADMADPQVPAAISHMAVMDRYLFANELNSRNLHRSDVNAPDTWTSQYKEAESNYSNLVAFGIQNLQIYLLKKTALEVWDWDSTGAVLDRLPQGFVQSGTVAPYSFTWCPYKESYAWLDENRRVVVLNGVTAEPISLTMNAAIQDFGTVSDAIGDYMEIKGRPYYILHFPTEEKTLAYDFISKNWYYLGYWDSGTSTYKRHRMNCSCFCPDWNLTLIGDRANGKIYKMSPALYDDDGDTLRALIRTAHYNWGSEAQQKICNGLYFRLKRTNVVADDGTPDLVIRYRDEGATSWSNEKTVSLQQIGGTEFYAKVPGPIGRYRTRQWEVVLSDAYPLCLVSVEEDIEVVQ